MSATEAPFTALVLAARRTADDPVALVAGVRNKCLADIGGAPILARVIDALTASGKIGSILVSTDDSAGLRDEPALEALISSSSVRLVPSGTSAPQSVLLELAREVNGAVFPVLVTTGDHALLSPAMVRHFCAETEAGAADLTVGLARAETVRSRFPEARRTYLRFRGGTYSGCNLFALRAREALRVVAFWSRAEKHRKSPLRLLRAFGPTPFALFALGLLTLDQAMRMASRKLGAHVAPVLMPQAEAAIDVDKPADLALVRRIVGAEAPAAPLARRLTRPAGPPSNGP